MEARESDTDGCAIHLNVEPQFWDSFPEDDDSLWAVIDRSERCLVSARNEESAELASSVLRSFCWTSTCQAGGQLSLSE